MLHRWGAMNGGEPVAETFTFQAHEVPRASADQRATVAYDLAVFSRDVRAGALAERRSVERALGGYLGTRTHVAHE